MAKKDKQIHPALYDVVRKPIVTEKSTLQGANNQLSFEVSLDANKPAIKEAVEQIFDVKVKSVNTIRQKGKVKRFRGKLGVRSDMKKAVVTLEEGQNIDVMAGA